MGEKIRGMWTCDTCGREFALMYEDRYTVRDERNSGLMASIGSEAEPAMWDAFDCPYCGCQNRVHSRKRVTVCHDMLRACHVGSCGDCGLIEVCPLSHVVDERDEEHGR